MLDFLITSFITLVVVIDPVGIAPLFIGLSPRASRAQRRSMAMRAVLIAAIVLYVFAAGGMWLLGALGVSLAAFRIAGGLLLFLLAVDMILARATGLRSTTGEEDEEARHHQDISVFPLAIPLLAGPGAMTSLVLLMARTEGDPLRMWSVLGMLAVVLLLCLLTLLGANQVTRLLGLTGANVVGRVLGIILAALAVQFVLDGLAGAGLIEWVRA